MNTTTSTTIINTTTTTDSLISFTRLFSRMSRGDIFEFINSADPEYKHVVSFYTEGEWFYETFDGIIGDEHYFLSLDEVAHMLVDAGCDVMTDAGNTL